MRYISFYEVDQWACRLPRQLPPSYEGRQFCISYELRLEMKVKGQPDIFQQRKFQLWPYFFFPLQNDYIPSDSNSDHDALFPFTRHYLERDSPLIFREEQISLVKEKSGALSPETALDRFIDRGIIPSLIDFRNYPRRIPPTINQYGKRLDIYSSHSHLQFNELALSGEIRPGVFALNLPNGAILANVRISRELLRVGEQLHCRVDFSPSRTIAVFQLVAQLLTVENVTDAVKQKEQLNVENVYRRHEMATWMHRNISFALSLPPNAPCTILADCLSLRWYLRLTLFCGRGGEDKDDGDGDGGEEKQNNDDVQKAKGQQLLVTPVSGDAHKYIICCDLPLRVMPSA